MKKYFFIVSSITLITIVGTGIMAKQEKNKNGEDFLEYQQVILDIEKGENLDEALSTIDKMQSKEKIENYLFNIRKGDIYIKQEEYKNALKEYEKALMNNLKLNKNPKFLITYAKLALDANENDIAKEMAIKARKVARDEEMNNNIDKILAKIGKE